MSSLLKLCLCIGAVTLVALGSAGAEDTPPAPAPEGEDDADVDVPDAKSADHADGDDVEGEAEAEGDEMLALPAKAEQIADLFGKIDTDKDGKMSMTEIVAFWKITRKGMLHIAGGGHDMETMDTNKDKKVSLEEFLKKEDEALDVKEDDARKKSFDELDAAKFKVADVNADGFLDEHELPHAVYGETHDEIVRLMAAHDLKIKDKDGDGKLDATEFNEGEEEPKAENETAEETAESAKELAEDFKKQDTDGDGKLNLEELVHWESGVFHITVDMKKLFEVCDGDKDAHITLKELTDNMPKLEDSAAAEHFNEWAEHHESMLDHHGEL